MQSKGFMPKYFRNFDEQKNYICSFWALRTVKENIIEYSKIRKNRKIDRKSVV